jgi:hypothetical protein
MFCILLTRSMAISQPEFPQPTTNTFFPANVAAFWYL